MNGGFKNCELKTGVVMDESRRLHYLKAMGIQVWQPRIIGESARATVQASELKPEPLFDQEAEPLSQSAPKPKPTTTTTTGATGAQAALQAIARASSARRTQAEEPAAKSDLAPVGRPTASQQQAALATSQPAPAAPATPSAHPTPTAPHQAASHSPSDALEPPPWLDEPPPWSDDEQPPWPTESDLPGVGQDLELGASSPTPDLAADQHPIANMDWDALEASVAECRRCQLCETRTKTVFGVGNRHAELMFIGEGPGQDEDRQGEPFVGRAGQLLNKMLAAVGLAREQVYIANIVKCRPPRNRNPASDEAAACRAYLDRQIALIQPKLIVSLGAVSANNLLGNTESVGRMRGKQHQYRPGDSAEPIPLMVTYHPSYYLRSPAEKAKGWQDLQRIIKTLREHSSLQSAPG